MHSGVPSANWWLQASRCSLKNGLTIAAIRATRAECEEVGGIAHPLAVMTDPDIGLINRLRIR